MKYQIGEYVVDTARYRITCGDATLPVEPKVFDLLVYLIRHRDRVLTRDELFREVWDGREVSDATLSNHVKSARKVLGDSGELQKTILTIRGRGYQFIAPVRELGDDTANPEAGKASPVSPRAWRLPLGVAVLVLVAAALFAAANLKAMRIMTSPLACLLAVVRRAMTVADRPARCMALR